MNRLDCGKSKLMSDDVKKEKLIQFEKAKE